jgi:PsbP
VACLIITTFQRSAQIQKAAARRGRAAAFLALAVAIAAVALLAGCGSGSIAYTDDQYRFALSYDAALTPTTHVTPAVSGSDMPAYVVAFLDPVAPRVGDRYVDGVWVAVMRLSAGAHWPPASAVAPELRRRLSATVVGDLHGSVTQALTRTANGRPAWVVGYDYRLGDTPVRALTYVIVTGDYEYQVTLQTAAARWPAMLPRLARSVDSFTVH